MCYNDIHLSGFLQTYESDKKILQIHHWAASILGRAAAPAVAPASEFRAPSSPPRVPFSLPRAKVEVYLTSDLMKAYINISKPEEGGKTLSYNDLEEALHNKKVKFGINKAELLKLSKNPVYDKDILIAEGISQVDGKDGTYEFKFRYKDLGIPKIKEDDTVDYFDLGIVQNVRKGDVLCIITKPDEGSEGQTVTGNIIKQKIGKPVPVLLGKNVEYGDENEEIIVSSIDGRVFLQGGKVNVEDEFYIKGNVDRSTGNIDFIGSITVGGIVEEGFSVKAGRNTSKIGRASCRERV